MNEQAVLHFAAFPAPIPQRASTQRIAAVPPAKRSFQTGWVLGDVTMTAGMRVLSTFSFLLIAAAGSRLYATGEPAAFAGVSRAQHLQPTRLVPNQVLSIAFDIVPTPWADQGEAFPPNLIFLEFRGGVTLSPHVVATATLFVDGVEVGSTTGEDTCQLCSSRTWQFAAPGFIDYFTFPDPAIVDFAPES